MCRAREPPGPGWKTTGLNRGKLVILRSKEVNTKCTLKQNHRHIRDCIFL